MMTLMWLTCNSRARASQACLAYTVAFGSAGFFHFVRLVAGGETSVACVCTCTHAHVWWSV
jgi:hypothetical protein